MKNILEHSFLKGLFVIYFNILFMKNTSILYITDIADSGIT